MRLFLLVSLLAASLTLLDAAEKSLGFDPDRRLFETYYSLDPDIAEDVTAALEDFRSRRNIDLRIWLRGAPPRPKTRHESILQKREFAKPLWQKAHEKFLEYDMGTGSKGGMLIMIDIPSRRLKIEESLSLEKVFPPEFIEYTEKAFFRKYFENDGIQQGVLDLIRFIDYRVGQHEKGLAFVPEEYKKDIERKKELETWWAKNNIPDRVLRRFVRLIDEGREEEALLLLTEESRRDLMKQPLGDEERDAIVYDYRICEDPTIVTTFTGDLSVIRYPLDAPMCRPWFFRNENGHWKIDYASMRNHLHHDGDVYKFRGWSTMPYRFAFYDAAVGRRGTLEPRGFKLGIAPIYEKGYGVMVFKVIPGTPAYSAGVMPGDAIVEFNGEPVKSLKGYYRILQKLRPGKPWRLVVRREGAEGLLEYRGVAVRR